MKMKPKTHCFYLAALLALGTGAAHAQRIPAKVALDRVAKLHGDRFVEKIVEMKGSRGQSQPEEWELIVFDPSSEYLLREFWIGDRRATNEGVNYDYYPKRQPAGFINLRRLKLGSVEAFNVLNKEADRARIGFDSIDYHLRCREFSDEPIWTLTAKDENGYQVARIDLSGETGQVLRTVWLYRNGRAVPRVKDSAFMKPPPPLRLIEDREPVRRIDDSEPIGPAIRRDPIVPPPIDPADAGIDPGTEVPEVVPIEPEEAPRPGDEP